MSPASAEYRIGITYQNLQNEFIIGISKAAQAKAKELGVTLIQADGQGKAEVQICQHGCAPSPGAHRAQSHQSDPHRRSARTHRGRLRLLQGTTNPRECDQSNQISIQGGYCGYVG